MTIEQVISTLTQEKKNALHSRFHCRAIMVKTIEQYCELLSALQKIPGMVQISSDELFPSNDVLPQYERIMAEKYYDQWVILPGVSEYLRLFNKSEAETQRFAKLWNHSFPASSEGRIIIPLWGCEALWRDKALHLCEDDRKSENYYDCADSNDDAQHMEMIILSRAFEPYVSQMSPRNSRTFMCLQEWYDYWSAPNMHISDFVLMTGRYLRVQPTESEISVKVIMDTLSFLREAFDDGDALTHENCPDVAASLLFHYALQGGSLKQAIARSLNVQTFSGTEMMSKWGLLTLGQKYLVKLWYALYPDESFLCHCITLSKTEAELQKRILLDVFTLMREHPAWIAESQMIISSMNLKKEENYFQHLDGIPEFEDRLPFLSGISKTERIYLLHMVGLWMRQSPDEVKDNAAIREKYPQLMAYIDGKPVGMDEDIRDYFTRYKSYKLSNTLPEDEALYFAGMTTDQCDYRYAALSSFVDDDCVVLWGDALGAEWLSLLLWALKKKQDLKMIHSSIALATLPTETCFNDQWTQMVVPYEKKDKLDKLAHKGIVDDPDYYACVEEQIEFVSNTIPGYIDTLLKKYHRVIITGDHGTSRLAARFFHKREGMPVPAGAKVCSHGRYCEASQNSSVVDPNVIDYKSVSGNRYFVYSNYDHFKISGFAAGAEDDNAIYGEIHGGATPEEMLVPVIVIDSKEDKPLSADWEKAVVKISKRAIRPVIIFNRPVRNIQVKIDTVTGTCTPSTDKKQWSIICDGLKPGYYDVSLVADGILLSVPKLTVKSALGDDDLFDL